jgi:hypothetical protein
VEVEDDRFIFCKKGFKLVVAETVRVVEVWDKLEKIDNVHETDLDLWEMLAQKSDSGERLLSWNITARRHHNVWFFIDTIGSEFPNTNTLGTMSDCIVHVEILEMLLLISDNDVDVVGATETMVGHREQAVGVWWEVDSYNFRAFVGDNVKKSRVLMGKAIVVLSQNEHEVQGF